MQKKIDINIAINSITALSNKKLNNRSIWLMDNSINRSTGQGTPNLVTACIVSQIIRWKITPVDLQTPASIKSIYFLDSTTQSKTIPEPFHNQATREFNDPNQYLWSGIVPITMIEGLIYRYRLEVQIGEGKNSLLYIDSPALKRVNPYSLL